VRALGKNILPGSPCWISGELHAGSVELLRRLQVMWRRKIVDNGIRHKYETLGGWISDRILTFVAQV
jgi:hypothetical protein